MNTVPKGHKQVFDGLIEEGDLLSGRGLGPVRAARIAIGNPVEGAAKNGIYVYRKQPLPSYTKELRKILKQELRSDLWCLDHEEFAPIITSIVKRIQRLNKRRGYV